MYSYDVDDVPLFNGVTVSRERERDNQIPQFCLLFDFDLEFISFELGCVSFICMVIVLIDWLVGWFMWLVVIEIEWIGVWCGE